ncbi:hypothetical protein K8S17_01150 [bacterium]|nr:hypothetical protein [bacterium]
MSSEGKRAFWEIVNTLDRRIIFVILLICVATPLLLSVGDEIPPTPPVQRAHAAVASLEAGDVLMVSIDFDATSAPELMPMLRAVLRQAFAKDIRVVLLGHIAIGLPLGHMALEEVAAEYGKTYGVDYVDLGYRPGYIAVMIGMGREIRDFFDTDYQGLRVDDLEVMRGVHSYEDIDLLFGFEHGAVIDYWVRYAQARFDQRMAFGTTAVMAPDAYPYLQAEQIEGLVGGLKGAAEYETLIGRPGLGTCGMPAQQWAHLLVIGFILLGNLGYFFTRRNRK